jgi:hypothetical protein
MYHDSQDFQDSGRIENFEFRGVSEKCRILGGEMMGTYINFQLRIEN